MGVAVARATAGLEGDDQGFGVDGTALGDHMASRPENGPWLVTQRPPRLYPVSRPHAAGGARLVAVWLVGWSKAGKL